MRSVWSVWWWVRDVKLRWTVCNSRRRSLWRNWQGDIYSVSVLYEIIYQCKPRVRCASYSVANKFLLTLIRNKMQQTVWNDFSSNSRSQNMTRRSKIYFRCMVCVFTSDVHSCRRRACCKVNCAVCAVTTTNNLTMSFSEVSSFRRTRATSPRQHSVTSHKLPTNMVSLSQRSVSPQSAGSMPGCLSVVAIACFRPSFCIVFSYSAFCCQCAIKI